MKSSSISSKGLRKESSGRKSKIERSKTGPENLKICLLKSLKRYPKLPTAPKI